ncbi:protein NRT1/ PTR FAMILY 8.3-like [Oryza brachyantha]|uniref:protein NRT1/ PTR FAMILY 8.3-like n=1 Tax=Oryza brachyantha TaxID=4533 RepID=UPI001ADC6F86|nr:protein NRT1/ PTR FAMILY 8.3-like [Oryza brachyantha]
MDGADEDMPLLHLHSQDVGSEYTRDGSVDINKQPALKHRTGNWSACFLILGVDFCENMAYYVIARNLVTFLTTVLHESKIDAARNVSAWVGACFLTPVVGAFLADTYWGRYWTIVVFLPVYITGMLILTVSASLPMFSASSEHGNAHRSVVYLGLYLAALGSGGMKPCTSSFGADQFDATDPGELAKKASFFSWSLFMLNASSLLSSTVLVWLQDNVGWGVGCAIPTVLMIISFPVFVAGSRVYRFRKPGCSPLKSLCQVLVAAVRKCHLELPENTSHLYEPSTSSSAAEGNHEIQHTNQFRFLDKAAIVLPPSDKTSTEAMSSWWLCRVTQVEELKMLLRMLPTWASYVIFNAVSGQMSSTYIEQGMAMDNLVGSFAIPPASLTVVAVVSVLVLVPIYEAMAVPLAKHLAGREDGGGLSQPQRIGIGLALSTATMAYAASLEMKRLAIVGDDDAAAPAAMSILWQTPGYFLHGVAEVFTGIGMSEFFYDQAPDGMKSLCSALGQLAIAAGAYLNAFILGVVSVATTSGGAAGWIPDNLNEGHLDYFFWMMAALSLINLVMFVSSSTRYTRRW